MGKSAKPEKDDKKNESAKSDKNDKPEKLNKIKGDNSDETLFGTAAGDEIDAKNGDDIVYAGDGNDEVMGGSGDDVLYGEVGDDIMHGQKGADRLFGGDGNDILRGDGSGSASGGGNGPSGDDYLDGGAGDDLVFGGKGDDIGVWTMSENFGASDYYDGGKGNDALIFRLTYGQAADAGVQAGLAGLDTFLTQNADPKSDKKGPSFTFNAFGELTLAYWESYSIELVNTGPTASGDSNLTDEDVVLTVTDPALGLIANDSDIDHLDVLTVVDFDAASSLGAAIGVNVDGSYSYDATAAYALQSLAAGETAMDSFDYTIADLAGVTSTATATIEVTGVNDAPVMSLEAGDSASEGLDETNAGIATSGSLTVTDVDLSDTVSSSVLAVSVSGVDAGAPDNAALLAMLSVNAAVVAAGANNGKLNWAFDSLGEAFDYLAVGEQLTLGYSVEALDSQGAADIHTVSVTITGSNDMPQVAAALTNARHEDAAAYTIDLLDGATDVDASDVLNVNAASVAQTAGRSDGWSLVGSAISIDPNAFNDLAVGESDTLSFAFDIEDGNGGVVAQTLSVLVEGRNDAPVVASVLFESDNEDASVFSIDLLNGASDVDASDVLNVDAASVAQTGGRSAGWSLDGNTISVDPNAFNDLAVGETETLEIAFDIVDGNGGVVAQTLSVLIEGRNDAPLVASALIDSSNEDASAYAIDLLEGATDVDASDLLNVNAASVAQTAGRSAGWSLVGNVISIDPNAFNDLAVGESGTLNFAFDIEDGNGGVVAQTLSVLIEGRNDAPVVASALFESSNEDAAVFSIDLLHGASDVDASDLLNIDSSSFTQTGGRAAGWTQVASGNAITIAPDAFNDLAVGETETLDFAFNIIDGQGGLVPQTLSVNIEGRNDAPILHVSEAVRGEVIEMLVPEGQIGDTGLISFSDVDVSDQHAVAIAPAAGVLGAVAAEIINVGGEPTIRWVYNVDAEAVEYLEEGETREEAFTLQLSDNNGGVASEEIIITVIGTAEAPSLDVATSAGEQVNEVLLSVTVDPAGSDSVNLGFENLPSGAKIFDAGGNKVNSALNGFVGTSLFTVVLPANADTNANIEVVATGFNEGQERGTSVEEVDLSFQVSKVTDLVSFGVQDQSMWSSDSPAIIGWHHYVPIVGGVAQVYNDATGTWSDNPAASPWSSGDFNLISTSFDTSDLFDEAIKGPRWLLTEARTVFDNAVAGVGNTLAAALETATVIFDSAIETATDIKELAIRLANDAYTAATGLANAAFDKSLEVAQSIFDTTMQAGEDTAQAVLEVAQGAFDAAVNVANAALNIAAGVRDVAHGADFLNLATGAINAIYQVAVDIRDSAVQTAQSAFDVAKNLFEAGTDAAIDAAQSVYDTAVSIATDAKNTAINIAGDALNLAVNLENQIHNAAVNLATSAFNGSKLAATEVWEKGVLVATTVLDAAQSAFDLATDAISQVAFKGALDVGANVAAEIGLKIDFELDLGSVDANVEYQFDSTEQFNHTTDVLSLTPLLTNLTTGDSVAFTTVSPNITFATTLVYDVAVDLDLFIDGVLQVGDDTIFDISPGGEGLNLNATIGTGGVEELRLVDLDTKDLTKPFDVPGLASLTENILSMQLAVPNLATEGTADIYTPGHFTEGGLVSLNLSEITDSFMSLVNAKLDLSPQIREQFGLASLQDLPDLQAVIDEVGEAFLATLFDALDGQSKERPIFLIDATDETSSSLLHVNIIPDNVIEDTLTDDTGTLGFYTAYGETNDIIKWNLDVDQAVAVIINKVVEAVLGVLTVGASTPITTALDDINPWDISIGLDQILRMLDVPEQTRGDITDWLDLSVGFESADVDVYHNLRLSQEFSLSIDDMSYMVTMEDGDEYIFAANADGGIQIPNASQHDANNDGQIDYGMELVPTAMFSNDTEVRMGVGYVFDFLTASLKAGFNIPLGNMMQGAGLPAIPGLGSISLNMVNVNLGPLLRVQGDLDLVSADIFESRFDVDLSSDVVATSLSIVDDVIVGTAGDDIFNGNQGNDIFTGGGGNDLYIFGDANGRDVVNDFVAGAGAGDVIDLSGIAAINSFEDVQVAAIDDGYGNTEVDLGSGNSVTLIGVAPSDLHADDFMTA